MRRYGAVVLCAVSLMVTGCSTIMDGTHRDVAITSYPDTARVIIDGVPKGTTPLVASLWRGGAHVVRFERDGQEPIEQSITRDHFHFWAAGNSATLGLGLLIDAWTGGLYDLSHKRLIANFPSHPDLKNTSTKTVLETGATQPGPATQYP